MKRKLLLLFGVFIGGLQNLGATTCANAVSIPGTPSMPYTQSLVCGSTDDINSSNATACGSANYMGGYESLYEWTPSSDYNNVVINYSGQYWSAIFLFDGCPTSGGTCLGSVYSLGSTQTLTVSSILTAGHNYYIMFDTYPTPNSPCSGTFTLNGDVYAPCTNPVNAGTANASLSSVCHGQNVNLSLSGTTGVGSGMAYQWQASVDGINFSNMPGATSSSYTGQLSATSTFRCIVACSTGGTMVDTSSLVVVSVGDCYVMSNGSDTTLCSGDFYDSGITSNYSNYEDYTHTFYPSTPGTLLQVNFSSFQLETCCDNLKIYSGNSVSAPLIGTFTTNPVSVTSSAADGSLTFKFHSDGSFVYSGWTATFTCVNPPANDSVCDAIALSVDSTVYNFSNAGATVGVNETSIAPNHTTAMSTTGWADTTLNATVWFTFVAPASGNLLINTTAATINGQVAVYEAADCANLSTFTIVAANDDAMDGSSVSPKFSICGLTPGSTYYLMYDSKTGLTGNFSIALSEISISAGVTASLLNVCTGDSVNLFNGITGNDSNGVWTAELSVVQTGGLYEDSIFLTAGFGYNLYNFEYVVNEWCATDTSWAHVQVFNLSSAGTDGTVSVCRNQPVNLLSGLQGYVDMAGTWYDPGNVALTSGQINASNIPSQYNYSYITGNGVCPDDTSNVLVNVISTCDYLDVEELYFGKMEVYPNPTSGIVNVTNSGSNEVFDYTVLDAQGRIIKSELNAINGNGVTTIDLTDKVNGVYFIRVFNNNAEKVYKVVVK